MPPSPTDDYKNFPFLTPSEFELAVTFFDQRYVRARLGPTRQIFKIRQRRTLTTGVTYLEILRLLKLPEEDEGLASALGRLLGGGDDVKGGEEDVVMECGDEEVGDGVSFLFYFFDIWD